MRREIILRMTEETYRQMNCLPEDATVEKALRRLAGLTGKEIRQAKFRRDGIRKNGKQCRVTEKVCPRDVVTVCLEDNETGSRHLEPYGGEYKEPLIPVYEDEDLLILNKPAGMAAHPAGGHYRDTLANMVQSYLLKKGELSKICPVGRLDRDTSGGMIFAKHPSAAARLSAQRQRGELTKNYAALVRGKLVPGDSGVITLPIAADPENRLRMRAKQEGKPAETHYVVEAAGQGVSLVSFCLKTGRTHQIRVHMAATGHPLLGDPLYGTDGDAGGMRRAALHAGKVVCLQPFTGDRLEFFFDFPEDMKNAAKSYGINLPEKYYFSAQSHKLK